MEKYLIRYTIKYFALFSICSNGAMLEETYDTKFTGQMSIKNEMGWGRGRNSK